MNGRDRVAQEHVPAQKGKDKPKMFRVEYSGSKAPAHFDIFEWGRRAFCGGTGWLYNGLFECSNLGRDIAIFVCGRQYPGTKVCR